MISPPASADEVPVATSGSSSADDQDPGSLPQASTTLEFGYPGDGGLGDRLVAAVLSGSKTATSSLAVGYLTGDPLPRVGEQLTLVDHQGTTYGTVETTKVRIVPLNEVGDDIAWAEGEGFTDAAEWRVAHEAFWRALEDLIRVEAGDEHWTLREAEPVVVQWFRLLGR